MVYRSQPRPGTGGSSRPGRRPPNAATLIGVGTEQAMDRGILFAGSPDTVFQQIMDLYEDGRRLRQPRDGGPVRLHDARGDREGHQAVREGGASAPR